MPLVRHELYTGNVHGRFGKARTSRKITCPPSPGGGERSEQGVVLSQPAHMRLNAKRYSGKNDTIGKQKGSPLGRAPPKAVRGQIDSKNRYSHERFPWGFHPLPFQSASQPASPRGKPCRVRFEAHAGLTDEMHVR